MSSVVDEDTVRAVDSGRETLGAIISSAQTHLQKVFIAFVIGFMGSFYALRMYIWDFLEATATSQMDADVAQATDIITRSPFEVILLQAKIGMLFGALVSIPVLLYYSRDALRRRGVQSVVPISGWSIGGMILGSIVLFCFGVFYAYTVFFPFAFDFLGEIAFGAGVKPSWGITEFTEFVALLTISFGLAAQLPLFMSILSYTEIVPYETFRDKWRHAIVGMTVFGALFSPPDPFTLVMWALPLVFLYGFSLGLAKILTNTRRRGAAELGSGTGLMKRRVLQFLALMFLAGAATFGAIQADIREILITEVVPELPDYLVPTEPTIFGTLILEYDLYGEIGVSLLVAVIVGFVVLTLFTIKVLQSPVYPRISALRTAQSPDDVDFDVLGVDDIEEVPAQVFLSMEEEEALDIARTAMTADDRPKAQAILDRYDSLHEDSEGSSGDASGGAAGGAAAAPADAGAGAPGDADEESSSLKSTAAGVLDSFTDGETTEEDIGGYAYDIAFILRSLTSKMFWIVGVFMAVLAGIFMWLYLGGIGDALEIFVDRVPDSVLQEVAERNEAPITDDMTATEIIQELDFVVALHPVEILVFIVKVSTIAAVISILPMVLYFGWPAAKERGLVRGDARVFLVWGIVLLAGFVVGTYLGFFWIAPAVISYLVTDAIENGMVVSYRIKSFAWLVVFTTVGIGLLFNIIVTMAMFHVGHIVHYRTMLRRWRPVVVGIFVFAAVASPKGILTMLIFAIPLALTYIIGLILLYVLTLGGRLFGGSPGGGTASIEPETDAVAE